MPRSKELEVREDCRHLYYRVNLVYTLLSWFVLRYLFYLQWQILSRMQENRNIYMLVVGV